MLSDQIHGNGKFIPRKLAPGVDISEIPNLSKGILGEA